MAGAGIKKGIQLWVETERVWLNKYYQQSSFTVHDFQANTKLHLIWF